MQLEHIAARIICCMKKIALLFLAATGLTLTYGKNTVKAAHETDLSIQTDPKKRYRRHYAQNYFDKKQKCYKWNKFCGR